MRDATFVGRILSQATRAELREVVAIHHCMFEKLLSGDGELSLAVAELFAETGRTYIRLSAEINKQSVRCGIGKIK
jgi:hypothetical protein